MVNKKKNTREYFSELQLIKIHFLNFFGTYLIVLRIISNYQVLLIIFVG